MLGAPGKVSGEFITAKASGFPFPHIFLSVTGEGTEQGIEAREVVRQGFGLLHVDLFYGQTGLGFQAFRAADQGRHSMAAANGFVSQAGTDKSAGTSARTLGRTLRITAPADYVAQSQAAAAADFGKHHLNLTIELRSGDRVSDMVSEGIDLAIRMGWLKDSSLRAQKLGEFQHSVIASQSYLDAMGTPTHPTELTRHRWIEFMPLPSGLTWLFEQDGERVQVHMNSHLKVDSTSALRSLIMNGAGLSVLAGNFSRQHPELITLFPDWHLPSVGIYAVFPPGAFIPAKVRMFVDFYRQQLASAE